MSSLPPSRLCRATSLIRGRWVSTANPEGVVGDGFPVPNDTKTHRRGRGDPAPTGYYGDATQCRLSLRHGFAATPPSSEGGLGGRMISAPTNLRKCCAKASHHLRFLFLLPATMTTAMAPMAAAARTPHSQGLALSPVSGVPSGRAGALTVKLPLASPSG